MSDLHTLTLCIIRGAVDPGRPNPLYSPSLTALLHTSLAKWRFASTVCSLFSECSVLPAPHVSSAHAADQLFQDPLGSLFPIFFLFETLYSSKGLRRGLWSRFCSDVGSKNGPKIDKKSIKNGCLYSTSFFDRFFPKQRLRLRVLYNFS